MSHSADCIDLCPQSVGTALRDLIQSVDDILPTLHESIRTEVHYVIHSFLLFLVSTLHCSLLVLTLFMFHYNFSTIKLFVLLVL